MAIEKKGIEFVIDLFDSTRNHLDFKEIVLPIELIDYAITLYEKYSQDPRKISPSGRLISNNSVKDDVAVFTITGGKDSLATFLKNRNRFNSTECFYVTGITSYVGTREYESAKKIADTLDFELKIIDLHFDYKTTLVESVIKNQMIYALVLDNLEYIPSFIGFGGTKEIGPQSMCFYHDSADAFDKFSKFAKVAWGEHGIVEFLEDEIESYSVIYKTAPQIIPLLSSCMTPDSKKKNIRNETIERFSIILENDYQCGACYKCAEEQIIAKEFFGRKLPRDYELFCRSILIDKCINERYNLNGLDPKRYLSRLKIH